MKKFLLIALFFGFSSTIFAQEISPATTSPFSMCPEISQIVKDPNLQIWSATTKEGYWKNFGISFATELTQFAGAQWVGEKVGQLSCIYRSHQIFIFQGQRRVQKTLPILLVYSGLVEQPKGKNWKAATHGVYNCLASSQASCPFVVRSQQQVGDIYEEAASLKSNNQNTQSPLDSD